MPDLSSGPWELTPKRPQPPISKNHQTTLARIEEADGANALTCRTLLLHFEDLGACTWRLQASLAARFVEALRSVTALGRNRDVLDLLRAKRGDQVFVTMYASRTHCHRP